MHREADAAQRRMLKRTLNGDDDDDDDLCHEYSALQTAVMTLFSLIPPGNAS